MVYAETKECGNSSIQSPRKPPQVPQKEEKRPHPCPPLQPPPRPLSEWRGEWIVLFTNKEGVSSHRRDALFDAKERPLQIAKGVSFN